MRSCWRRASPSSVAGTVVNKGNQDTQACVEGRPWRRPRKRAVISKPRWETQNGPFLSAHRESQPYRHHGFGLFCSLELRDREFLLHEPPSLWCFVMAALTNESTWPCGRWAGVAVQAPGSPLPKHWLQFGTSSSVPHLSVFSFFSVMSDSYNVWWGRALIQSFSREVCGVVWHVIKENESILCFVRFVSSSLRACG